jgi:hypothetical protein
MGALHKRGMVFSVRSVLISYNWKVLLERVQLRRERLPEWHREGQFRVCFLENVVVV